MSQENLQSRKRRTAKLPSLSHLSPWELKIKKEHILHPKATEYIHPKLSNVFSFQVIQQY